MTKYEKCKHEIVFLGICMFCFNEEIEDEKKNSN